MNPLSASALELAAAIRERRITSRAVVEAHLERLDAVNPQINAVVVPLADRARAAAAAADARLDAGDEDPPPLLGVPCTIKEAFAVEGLPNTGGLVSRRDTPATTTAPAVRRLLDAGAIPLGLTNVSELCMWFESANRVYGRTSSAYDRRRTAGGSSGGEGAVVGAGASPFGLGSDVGGSIRMPAFFNGVFGHKASPGLVPNEGQIPPAGEEIDRMLATGPLCRRAEDLMPLVEILADRRLGDPAAVELDGLPVLAAERGGPLPVRADVRDAVHRAAGALAAAGARVRHDRVPGLDRSIELWLAAMRTAEPGAFAVHLGGGTARRRRELLGELARGRSPHTLPSIGLALLESLGDVTPRRTARLLARRDELAAEVAERIGDGVLLYPPHPRVAPRHHQALLTPLAPGYTAVFNVLGLPVTQVPLGLNRRGVPVGVQVVARPGNDHVSIAVALELERRTGGWVAPTEAAAATAR